MTRAVIFLGTPHGGSESANSRVLAAAEKIVEWATLRPGASTELVNELKPYSKELVQIGRDFCKDPSKDIEIISFFEQKPTRVPGWKVAEMVSTKYSAANSN